MLLTACVQCRESGYAVVYFVARQDFEMHIFHPDQCCPLVALRWTCCGRPNCCCWIWVGRLSCASRSRRGSRFQFLALVAHHSEALVARFSATAQKLSPSERLTIFTKSDFYFCLTLFIDRLTDKEDYTVNLLQKFPEMQWVSSASLTSRPAPASCISHTQAPAAPSGWGRCSRVAQSCCWPGRWSVAAGWRRRRCSRPSPGWGQSKQPGCTAASCSRRCTESHWDKHTIERLIIH